MAILKEKKEFHPGDMVNAEIINDTIETAVEAYKLAKEAKEYAETMPVVGQTKGNDIY